MSGPETRKHEETVVSSADEAYQQMEKMVAEATAGLSKADLETVASAVQPDLDLLDDLRRQMNDPAESNSPKIQKDLTLNLFNETSHRIAQTLQAARDKEDLLKTGKNFPDPDLGEVFGDHSPSGKRVGAAVFKGHRQKAFTMGQAFVDRAMGAKRAAKDLVLEPPIASGDAADRLFKAILGPKPVDMKKELEGFLVAKQKKEAAEAVPGITENKRWDETAGGAASETEGASQRWRRFVEKVEGEVKLTADKQAKLEEYQEKISGLLSNDVIPARARVSAIDSILAEAERQLLGISDKSAERGDRNRYEQQSAEKKTKKVNEVIVSLDQELEKRQERNLSDVLSRLPGEGQFVRSAIRDALNLISEKHGGCVNNMDLAASQQNKAAVVRSLLNLARVLHQLPQTEAYLAFYNRAVGEYGLDGDRVFQAVAGQLVGNYLPLAEGKAMGADEAINKSIASVSLTKMVGLDSVPAEAKALEQKIDKVISAVEGLEDKLFGLGAAGQKLKSEMTAWLEAGGDTRHLQEILSSLVGVLDRVYLSEAFSRLRDELFRLDREKDGDRLHEIVGGKILEKFLPLKTKKGMGNKEIDKEIEQIGREIFATNGRSGKHVPPGFQPVEPNEELVDFRQGSQPEPQPQPQPEPQPQPQPEPKTSPSSVSESAPSAPPARSVRPAETSPDLTALLNLRNSASRRLRETKKQLEKASGFFGRLTGAQEKARLAVIQARKKVEVIQAQIEQIQGKQ